MVCRTTLSHPDIHRNLHSRRCFTVSCWPGKIAWPLWRWAWVDSRQWRIGARDGNSRSDPRSSCCSGRGFHGEIASINWGHPVPNAACPSITEPNQGQDCLHDMHRQAVPCRENPLQISVKGCQFGTIGAPALQHICSATSGAIAVTAITVRSYGGASRGFDSHRRL